MCGKLAVDHSPLFLFYPDNFARSAAHFGRFETNVLCDEQTWSNSIAPGAAGAPVQRVWVSERRHRLGNCGNFLQTLKHLFKPTVKSSHTCTISYPLYSVCVLSFEDRNVRMRINLVDILYEYIFLWHQKILFLSCLGGNFIETLRNLVRKDLNGINCQSPTMESSQREDGVRAGWCGKKRVPNPCMDLK